MITSIIGWILFGLIAGAVARLIHPGTDDMGLLATMLLGITGSLVGGGLAWVLRIGTSPWEPASWIMSVLGAILLLALGFFGTKKRRHV